MSRGQGVVQRFILDYLAAEHPEPDQRSSFDFPRKRQPVLIGHPLHAIAATYRGPDPERVRLLAIARPLHYGELRPAVATLRRAGLIEVQHREGYPHMRLSKTRPAAQSK